MFALLRRLRSRNAAGPRGERAAARFLRHQGYRILARNIQFSNGEIDLLAQAPDARMIVVVEVKAAEVSAGQTHTPSPPRIRPEVHVNRAKQRKLITLAAQAAKRYHLEDRPIRFDVIGVDLPPKGKPTIRHHISAFESWV